jgi:hypothetical protein
LQGAVVAHGRGEGVGAVRVRENRREGVVAVEWFPLPRSGGGLGRGPAREL